MWVYVFDDSDEQVPPPYLAKAPVPLGALATGRELKGEGRSAQIKKSELKILQPFTVNWRCRAADLSPPTGDYVFRDPAGNPRGAVRVLMRWKYPFQPPVGAVSDADDVVTDSHKGEERRRERDEASPKPVAKPRVKVLTASKKLKKGVFLLKEMFILL